MEFNKLFKHLLEFHVAKNVIAMTDDPILGKCEACKLMQATTPPEANWYIRKLVQNTSATNSKLQLGFNHEQVTLTLL